MRLADNRVTHPLASSYVRSAATQDGAAARRGERSKHHRYGRTVLPLVTETFGRLGPEALRWWRELAKQVAEADKLLKDRGKWAMAGLLAQWWAETSVALQRANADALLASLGDPAAETAPRGQERQEGEETGGAQEGTGLGDEPVTVALLPTGR